jgi:hypothetical protein
MTMIKATTYVQYAGHWSHLEPSPPSHGNVSVRLGESQALHNDRIPLLDLGLSPLPLTCLWFKQYRLP